jgi:hypothetical protein
MACLARGTARPERRFPTAAASCSWRRVDTPRTDNHVPAEHAGRGAGPPHMAPAFAPVRAVTWRRAQVMEGWALLQPGQRSAAPAAAQGGGRNDELKSKRPGRLRVLWHGCSADAGVQRPRASPASIEAAAEPQRSRLGSHTLAGARWVGDEECGACRTRTWFRIHPGCIVCNLAARFIVSYFPWPSCRKIPRSHCYYCAAVASMTRLPERYGVGSSSSSNALLPRALVF